MTYFMVALSFSSAMSHMGLSAVNAERKLPELPLWYIAIVASRQHVL